MVVNQFLELLRAGLWQRPADSGLFEGTHTDWKAIRQLAHMQTVFGIVYDGIRALPPTLQPERSLLMQWTAQVARIEQANEHLNKIAVELFELYRLAGLTPVLLKGQGIAMSYPNPKRRQCGDIDVFLKEEDYKCANEALLRAGGKIVLGDNFKHTVFDFRGVTIENHAAAERLNNPFANRKYQQMVHEHLLNKTSVYHLNEGEVVLPDATFNVYYIFLHAFHHFLEDGVGLRQVCDWARVVAVNQGKWEVEKVLSLLKRTRLECPFRAFASVAVDNLGLDESLLPFALSNADRCLGKELLSDMLKMGNFGKYNHTVSKRPLGYWAGKWHTFRRILKRSWNVRKFAPSEVYWSPFGLIRNSIDGQLSKM